MFDSIAVSNATSPPEIVGGDKQATLLNQAIFARSNGQPVVAADLMAQAVAAGYSVAAQPTSVPPVKVAAQATSKVWWIAIAVLGLALLA
jgi:hypothetical protein